MLFNLIEKQKTQSRRIELRSPVGQVGILNTILARILKFFAFLSAFKLKKMIKFFNCIKTKVN